jgi:sugar O-acyltransferase (sialic acid O-acetyltransferase NeuD family)
MKQVVIIGYSGHGLVAAEILTQSGYEVIGYCDQQEKEKNPYNLPFLGSEDVYFATLRSAEFFVAIGDNKIRQRIQAKLLDLEFICANAIHPSARIARGVYLGEGVMIGANVVVNPCSEIFDGAILNTGCIVEHECQIGAFSHISPGATLCGNVRVGAHTWVGANAVVKKNIKIGDRVVVGAGSVVVKDVPDQVTIIGNPARVLGKKV